MRLDRLVDIHAFEVSGGLLEELHDTLVYSALRDVVDDVQRLVQTECVVVNVPNDFECVGLHG